MPPARLVTCVHVLGPPVRQGPVTTMIGVVPLIPSTARHLQPLARVVFLVALLCQLVPAASPATAPSVDPTPSGALGSLALPPCGGRSWGTLAHCAPAPGAGLPRRPCPPSLRTLQELTGQRELYPNYDDSEVNGAVCLHLRPLQAVLHHLV